MTSQTGSARKVPITDLGLEYRSLQSEIDSALERVLASGSYVLGAESDRFEKALCAYTGARHAIGVNSGTDALLLAYRALGIGPGDEVILPGMTFIATAEPLVLLGATPIFADIDPATYTIDPQDLSRKLTKRTKAICVVHLYGLAADMDPILKLAREANVPVVEDMAQSIGATYAGKSVGTFGDIGCLSFFPTKNLGACGDAGALLTGSDESAERIRGLRNHGQSRKYYHEQVGYNSRLDELQAAILNVKLSQLDEWNEKRRLYARAYTQRLTGLPLVLPKEVPGREHVFHLYCVKTQSRDALQRHLADRGVATGLHYPMPLHFQPAFKGLGGRPGDLPNSEELAAQTLSLPLYPHMTMDDVAYVCDGVRSFFAKGD